MNASLSQRDGVNLADVRLPDPPGRGRESKAYKRQLKAFATDLRLADQGREFKMSARGWAYALENAGVVTKDEFDYVERTVNKCRERGHVPLDFTAGDDARAFEHTPTPPAPDAGVYTVFLLGPELTPHFGSHKTISYRCSSRRSTSGNCSPRFANSTTSRSPLRRAGVR